MKRIENNHRMSKVHTLIILIAFITLFVACSNCCGLQYLLPAPKQWYNASFDPAPNVIIGLEFETEGPGPITILDSDTGKIGFGVYYHNKPIIYLTANESYTIMYLFIAGTDTHPNVGAETIVYLPPDNNYTLVIHQPEIWDSPVNNNATGNVTLLINDPNHSVWDVSGFGNMTRVD